MLNVKAYRNRMSSSSDAQSGVAMIEVLIAIVVIAFGFFALLKLQMTTLNNVSISNQRFVAANIAQDMGERVRANASNFAAYKNSTCGGICATDYTEVNAAITQAENSLPGGAITIEPTTDSVIITISWNEKTGSGIEAATYTLEVPIYV